MPISTAEVNVSNSDLTNNFKGMPKSTKQINITKEYRLNTTTEVPRMQRIP